MRKVSIAALGAMILGLAAGAGTTASAAPIGNVATLPDRAGAANSPVDQVGWRHGHWRHGHHGHHGHGHHGWRRWYGYSYGSPYYYGGYGWGPGIYLGFGHRHHHHRHFGHHGFRHHRHW